MNVAKKFLKVLIAVFLMITSLLNTSVVKAVNVNNGTLENVKITQDYPVVEDAYIRSGDKANTNYNFESIGKAHGEQYVGKNYKTLSAKNYGSSEIISVMKYNLPTQIEIEQNKFDKYEFEFQIFKNPGFNSDQNFKFYLTDNNKWKETEITWNNKPEEIKHDGDNLLFDFAIKKGNEFENKPDAEKTIRVDVTKKVEELISKGIKQVTVYVVAENPSDMSLMIHDRTSGVESIGTNTNKASKFIASHEGIDLEMLKNLIKECEGFDKNSYTEESFTAFSEVLEEVKTFVNTNPTDALSIRDMYKKLENAKNSLVYNGDINDPENIAYKKATRSNLNKTDASKVVDGDSNTYWQGNFFPSYVDVDLMETYDISEIELSFPKDKVIYYTLYGSNDGKTYDELYQSRSDEPKTEKADIIDRFENGCQYRILRVYLEYTENANGSKDNNAYLSEIKVHGTKTNLNTEELRKGSFEEMTGIQPFDETEYASLITIEETIENVYGIIDRIIGVEYRDWFTFEIAENVENTNDYYELSDKDEKIHIKGNDGITLTTGLNYYFKNYANVQVSEQSIQGEMPEKIVPIGETVRKETSIKTRYAFNYCTLSYTFAFFGEEEWQRENDWLALNGVNVVLDLAGQEATWIKFLMEYGYSFDDAKDWLVGPGYMAWQFMQNMEVFGGPLPDDYIIDRVELARKTQRWKRSLGMQTILQGYAGMVPTNFNDYQPDIETIVQGGWGDFTRPSMIATDSDDYDKMASDFYESQKFIYGETTDYYAVDPFHEGGKRPSGLTDDIISKEVLESMLKYDQNAIWTVQGWQSNPTSDLLKGMAEYKEDHVLIVDLIKYPLVSSGEAQYKKDEFQGTNWAWCLLGNFGGNPSMNGELQTMVNEIQNAKANSKHMKGIGVISEAMYDNPMLYDLVFDLAWTDENFNVDNWIRNYIERRYGAITENAVEAWNLIKNANYNEGIRLTKELFGVRTGGVPRNVGKGTTGYDISNLENALRLLVTDFDKFKESEAYLYDLSEIMRQVVSNYALYQYHNVIDARDAKDIEKFRVEKEKFLHAFDILNEVSSTQQDQLAGEWIGKALDRAANYDDFSKSVFEMNAKSIITTWGSTKGNLIDYGFRTYEGMFLDLRKTNWIEYLEQVEENILNGTPITTPTSASGYSQKYWKWVISDQEYTRIAKDSPDEVLAVTTKVLNDCVFTGELDPNIGNIAIDRKVTINHNDDYENSELLTDGKAEESLTVSSYEDNGEIKEPEIVIDLLAEFELSKIQVLANNESQYEIFASIDGKDWTSIAKKIDIKASEDGDIFESLNANGRYIKMIGASTEPLEVKEIRFYGNRLLPNLEQLENLISVAENLEINTGTEDDIKLFETALEEAKEALKNQVNVDTIFTVYWQLYDKMICVNTNGISNIALGKKVEAHNDPNGKSENINDGQTSTKWDGGRLSATGKPYEDQITPGWVIIDLDGLYDISQMNLLFSNSNIWHQYEIYTSLDKQSWEKIGEKKTETKPNEQEDNYLLNQKRARYVKLYATNIQKGNDNKRNSYGVQELQVFGKKVVLNKDELINTIVLAEQKVQEDYTTDSWKRLAEALSKAKEIETSDLVKQLEINNAVSDLLNAMNELEKRGDTSQLSVLVDSCLQLNEKDYTEESWNKFIVILEKAENVISDHNNLNQGKVDDVYEKLLEAKNLLVKIVVVDKEKLENSIKEAEKLNSSKYTEETWKLVIEALTNAREVLANEAATQEDIEKALTELETAVKGLTEKTTVDTSKLEALIKEAEQIKSEGYTEISWKKFEQALVEAKATLAKENPTQQEVDGAVIKLKEAMAQLEKDDDNIIGPVGPDGSGNQGGTSGDNTTPNGDTKPGEGDTGDTTNAALFLFLLMLSGGALALIRNKKEEA